MLPGSRGITDRKFDFAGLERPARRGWGVNASRVAMAELGWPGLFVAMGAYGIAWVLAGALALVVGVVLARCIGLLSFHCPGMDQDM